MEGVWWGLLFSTLSWGFRRMRRIIQGTKNWRPIVGLFTMADRPEMARSTFAMARRISSYQGLTMANVMCPVRQHGNPAFTAPEDARLVTVPGDDFGRAILGISQAAQVGGLDVNTVLLPSDMRLNHVELIESLIKMRKNVLLYSHGRAEEDANRIDVWWKGEENGNLMALLAYMINISDSGRGRPRKKLRLIRKLFQRGDDESRAKAEMDALLASARLEGEVCILPEDGQPIHESIRRHSADAWLILMGVPGRGVSGLSHLFALDRLFFTREIQKFDNLPPLLFVKACEVMDLFE
jgi:hypothetical protein